MRSQPEYALQCAVADYLRLALYLGTVWTTIGHGGGGKIRGAKLKRAGLRVGVADIYLSWWDEEYHRSQTMWLELKSSTGRATREQEQFAREVEANGHHYYVCRSIEDVKAALENHRVPRRTVKVAA